MVLIRDNKILLLLIFFKIALPSIVRERKTKEGYRYIVLTVILISVSKTLSEFLIITLKVSSLFWDNYFCNKKTKNTDKQY